MDRLDDARKELRGEMREGFAKVDERFDKVQEEFTSVRSHSGFERMQRTLIAFASAIIAALIASPHL